MMEKPYILTIDDDEDFNRWLKVVLGKQDFKVQITTTVGEFLVRAKEEDPKPDLLLIDLNLEEAFGAGFQVIQLIREKIGHDIPIIVLSKRHGRDDIAHALEIGANDFLPKPADPLLLNTKIRQWILPQKSSNTLAFKNVTGSFQPCHYHLQLTLDCIDELGITVRGPLLLAKRTTLRIGPETIPEIFGDLGPQLLYVQHSRLDGKTGEFFSYLEFDFENEALMAKVRNWILKQSKQKED